MSLIHRPISGLGSRTTLSAATFRRSGVQYDYALGGVGLLAAVSEKFPYGRETAEFRKQQFDASDNPGEQSLTGWWMRAQSSFHFGTGVRFMEPANDDEVMNAFHSSKGVNPWVPGELTLLRATALKQATTGDALVMGVIQSDGTDSFILADKAGTTVRLIDDAANATITWGGAADPDPEPLSITTDGENYYIANATGIYKGTVDGGAGSKVWDTGDTDVVIEWVKERLVAGIGNKIYELVGGTPPTLPTELYEHPATGWKWTAIAESPSAIYAAGYVGGQSSIYKFTLSTTGAMPTLTSGITAATLPTGEVVHSLFAYVGALVAIGTNKGVRIGEITADGDINYGPLVIESTSPVRALTGQDRFIYAACTEQIDGSSGLWRIDLGSPKKDGRYAYATDLCIDTTGEVTSATLLGASGRLVIGADSGAYLESATDLVVQGYVQTAYVRFNTVEPKRFEYITARMTGAGTVGIESVDEAGVASSIVSIASGSSTPDYPLGRVTSETVLGLRFTLNQATATTGPTLTSWQIKAQPSIVRQRIIRIPILLFESMRDNKGAALPPVDVH